jgi:phospho-N-acetylmuramoyl-pentapeptide-transferase
VPVEIRSKIIAGVLMALGFGVIGFADDYIKVVKKRNLGLTVIQKTVAQILVMVAYLLSLFMSMNGKPYMFVPFVPHSIEMGVFFWFFGACVIYATINAVNFTDGIDGLCSSVTLTAAVSFFVIAVLKEKFGVSLLAACLAGGCAGFLVWNHYPAKVFMGDTGSMFLGGLVVALAYALDCPVILLPVGIIYVIEGMSDVIQIGYFKLTHGKRIFKMAPIHHHFEMSGWSEKKSGAVGVLLMYFG